jgi:hypothetical protein
VLTALITVEAAAQTEPEAPRPPEVLYNGFQLSATGGLSMNHIVGEYYGDCPCEFYGNTTSTSPYFGASLNIPVFEDAALLLRVGINNSSSSWETGRNDSLWTSPEIGTIFSNLIFEYELLSFDVLARLIGAMDGPRLLVGPSFSAVKRKHLRIVDEEFVSGAQRVVEDGDLQVDQETRISMILGFEYAFTPVHNLYVIPSFEVDYPFAKLLNQDGVDPDFSLRPIFYRLLVSVSYQLF